MGAWTELVHQLTEQPEERGAVEQTVINGYHHRRFVDDFLALHDLDGFQQTDAPLRPVHRKSLPHFLFDDGDPVVRRPLLHVQGPDFVVDFEVRKAVVSAFIRLFDSGSQRRMASGEAFQSHLQQPHLDRLVEAADDAHANV